MNSAALDPRIAGRRLASGRTSPTDWLRERTNWPTIGLLALLLLTATAYIWNLTASGYANSFYAAAVQAGTKSWKAFFFGSIDSSNFITVDKPPASMWVMELSGRLFGFSSASMLVPQALEGVTAVALLYAAVRRQFGAWAGLAAGLMLACTPVAALMFRFNNPDALLVMLMTAGAYCMVRALEKAQTKWILAAGAMIGLAFLAKMLQAFLVLPAFSLVYVIAAPTTLRRRIVQLFEGGVAVVVSAGWWVALVALWPVASRPFIDGSPDNNIFNLITGYNGLERVFAGGGAGGGAGANFSGSTGVLRLFNDLMGGQASWLLPAALLALAGGLWATRRAPRTDGRRAALLLWGGWLIVTAIVFSFGQGVIHTYYAVALAPAIAALVAIGGAMLWERRDSLTTRLLAALAVGGTAAWAYALLERTPGWNPWLATAVALAGSLAVVGLLLAPLAGALTRRLTTAALVLGIVAMLAGPVAYSAQTISTAHTGSIPSAGPTIASSGFGGGGGFPGGAGGGPSGGLSSHVGASGASGPGGPPPTGGFGGSASGMNGGAPAGAPGGASATAGLRGGSVAGGGAGAGGPGGASQVSSAEVSAVERDASHYRWVAATFGSQTAASIELATGGDPVMAIGGFNNNGGEISLAAFKAYVAAGEIHYFIGSGSGGQAGPGGSGGSGSTSEITSWVKAHFTSVKVGGETVYDLTQPISGTSA